MQAALALLYQMLPLYLTVVLGWVAGRYMGIGGRNLAGVMMYIILPSVVFLGVMNAPLTTEVILLPFIVLGFCSCLGLLHLVAARRLLGDASANMIPLAVGTGNTGYFGIPLALLLFGEQGLAVYIVCMLGTTLYESSVGFYLAARGRYGLRECLRKVSRLPSLYAFFLAVGLNLLGLGVPDNFVPMLENMRGAYIFFGMMIIGMSIQSFRGLAGNLRFTTLAFFGKFVSWPLLAIGFWLLDSRVLGFYDAAVHQGILLISITPIAANTVVIATLLDVEPRQVAGTALLSTIFALLYVPLMAGWIMTI
jgi:malate permease and related proteins